MKACPRALSGENKTAEELKKRPRCYSGRWTEVRLNHGRPVRLVGPQGIFKPICLELPLAITTVAGLLQAVRAKIVRNAEKYPVASFKGSARKYSDERPSHAPMIIYQSKKDGFLHTSWP